MANIIESKKNCILLGRAAKGYLDLPAQLDKLKSFATRNGYQVQDVVVLDEREQVSEPNIMRACREKNASNILCWRMDCLGPSFKDFYTLCNFLGNLTQHGLRIKFVADEVDTSSAPPDFLAKLTGAWKNLKAARRAENARASLIKAKERGSKLGRRKTRDDERVIEARLKGATIREIAAKFGISTTAVQRSIRGLRKE
jgi:DNA invertase Pin-like site-specific DNA recombinase